MRPGGNRMRKIKTEYLDAPPLRNGDFCTITTNVVYDPDTGEVFEAETEATFVTSEGVTTPVTLTTVEDVEIDTPVALPWWAREDN